MAYHRAYVCEANFKTLAESINLDLTNANDRILPSLKRCIVERFQARQRIGNPDASHDMALTHLLDLYLFLANEEILTTGEVSYVDYDNGFHVTLGQTQGNRQISYANISGGRALINSYGTYSTVGHYPLTQQDVNIIFSLPGGKRHRRNKKKTYRKKKVIRKRKTTSRTF